MLSILQSIIEFCTVFIMDGGIFFGFFLVILESFIPVLPLSVFVALNVNAFGFLIGCFISWIASCLGSFICYLFFTYISKKISSFILSHKMNQKVHKSHYNFRDISFSHLVLLLTLPFTPTFFINVLCGVSKIDFTKFIFAIMIGKFFSIIFWGYIGKSLFESITDLSSIIYILITLIIAYFISNIISRKMNIT